MIHEPVARWWLLWRLYGLPRCTGIDDWHEGGVNSTACQRLVWPWQARHRADNGAVIHDGCYVAWQE